MNRKHEQFINEYLLCWNATQAYLKVYPKSSYEAARRSASDLLTNPDIDKEIQERISENAMSANEVLNRLAQHARGDIDDYLNDTGNFDLEKARQARRTKLIKKLKTRTTQKSGDDWESTTVEVEFELYDAQAALVQIGKHHKLFADRTEITGDGGGPIQHKNVTDLSDEDLARIASAGSAGVVSQATGAQ